MTCSAILCAFVLAQATQEKRLAPPAGEELKKAEEAIASVFAKEYAAIDRDSRRLAARRLLEEAPGIKGQAERFVALRDAARVGAESVDLGTTLCALDLMTSEFDVSTVDAYASAIATARKAKPLSREDVACVAEICLGAWAKSTAIHDHKAAAGWASQALELSKTLRPPDEALVQAAVEMAKDSEEAGKMMDRAWGAATVLSKGVSDPKACLDLGLYHAAARSDWPKALEFLPKVSVPAIAEVARLDAGMSADPEAMFKAGELWAALASKERLPILKRAYEARSRHWKESAYRVAVGLPKTSVSRKLSNGFAVVKATYGLTGGGKPADVTAAVANALDRDPWSPIRAGDELAGIQTPGIETLTVDYTWNGKPGRETAKEGEVLVVPCAAGKPSMGPGVSRPFRLLCAHYGTGAKFIDVTSTVTYVKGPYGLFRALDFGIDPSPGMVKTAVLQYEWHGRRFVRVAKEGESVSIAP